MKRIAAFLAAALALLSAAALADDAPPRTALRVCQDPNNLPFANDRHEGIENRIAEVFGRALGLPVEYYSYPQRFNFVRNTLRYKVPGEDYRCDIMLGVPVGFDQVSVTKPYYRSTHALVLAPTGALAGVKSVEDFLALDRAVLAKLRIGVYDQSPGSAWLARHGLVDSAVPYAIMNADPDWYPGSIIDKDLAAGKIDAAIVWGPIAGYYAKRVKSPALEVLPMKSEPEVRMDYAMAMGVRYGEREWKAQVESLIESQRPAIVAILREFGVPLVEDAPAPR